MNKEQLLADLNAQPFVERVMGITLIEEKPNNVKWYQANVFQTYVNAASCVNIDFYVTDEGMKEEKAYYKDEAPVSSVREETKAMEATKMEAI